MKCLILFCRKSKKNIINWSSAELAQRVLKVKVSNEQKQLKAYIHLVSTFNIFVIGSDYKLQACHVFILHRASRVKECSTAHIQKPLIM